MNNQEFYFQVDEDGIALVMVINQDGSYSQHSSEDENESDGDGAAGPYSWDNAQAWDQTTREHAESMLKFEFTRNQSDAVEESTTCGTCGNPEDVWACGFECSDPEVIRSRYTDWGDAWTLADGNPVAIHDAGYQGDEELGLFLDGRLVNGRDMTIDEISRHMTTFANREAAARNEQTWEVAKRA